MQQQLPAYSLTEASCIMQRLQLPQARTMLAVTLLSAREPEVRARPEIRMRLPGIGNVPRETLYVRQPLSIIIKIYSLETWDKGNVFTGRVFELTLHPPGRCPCRAYSNTSIDFSTSDSNSENHKGDGTETDVVIDEIKHARTAKSGAKSEKKELFLFAWSTSASAFGTAPRARVSRIVSFFFFCAARCWYPATFISWLSRTRCAHEAETGIPCGRVLRVRVATVALVTVTFVCSPRSVVLSSL